MPDAAAEVDFAGQEFHRGGDARPLLRRDQALPDSQPSAPTGAVPGDEVFGCDRNRGLKGHRAAREGHELDERLLPGEQHPGSGHDP